MKPAFKTLLFTLTSALPLSLVILPTYTPVVRGQTNVIAQTTVISNPTQPTIQEKRSPQQVPTIVIPDQPVSNQSTTTTNTPKPTTTPNNSNSSEDKKSSPNQEPTDTPKTSNTENKEPAPSPEEIAKRQKLIQADQLYMGGQYSAAEKIYREVKTPFSKVQATTERKEVISDLDKLPVAGQVYWRISTAGLEQGLETKIFVPLTNLVEKYPEFIPGQLRYAQVLKNYNRNAEALQVLEKATTLYPNQPDLLKAKIALLGESKQWLEASLAARQFALLNPNNSQSDEFNTIADKNLERYQSHLRAELRGNTIVNAITGVLGYAVTGSLLGPVTAVQSTAMLLRGESAVGEGVSKQAKRVLPLVEDQEVLDYVREIGNKLATVAGRKDFEYEFYVVMDDELNAFALPGGKVFVNAGAILRSNSEAELAGLMAHELSHAVLSHGFQLATQGNLTANITQFIPYGGTLGNLIVLDYSRDMERQADFLGTRLLTSTGYAADGLHNLMVTLNKQDRDRPLFSWLSSHPVTNERISYLEDLIVTNGYNRFAYEGVTRHTKIQEKVKQILQKAKDKKESRRDRDRRQQLELQF
ncbi:MAG TPA: M48 family metalloprotease [Oculatellaceae cyanobacterium]|jgi:predicted Zn-dependent protease